MTSDALLALAEHAVKIARAAGADAADALACAICHAHGGLVGAMSTKGYRVKGGRLVK